MFLTILAIIPGIVLLGYVYKLDKIEKEPTSLIIKLLVFGVLIVIPAAFLENKLLYALYSAVYPDSILAMAIENFLCIALVEEGLKYLATKIGAWKSPAFDYRFDGIVYAVCVSMGFAIVENILYVLDGGLKVALLRAVLSIPGHCIFGVYMGYYLGLAKMQEKKWNENNKASLIKALLVPTILHGSYDFLASSNGTLGLFFFVFIIALELIAFKKVKEFSQHDAPVSY